MSHISIKKIFKIKITMLERPKISPSQQPRSLGTSPSHLASKSLGVKIENGEVTWGKHSSDLGFKIGDRKRAQFTPPTTMIDGTPCHDWGATVTPHGWMHAHIRARPSLWTALGKTHHWKHSTYGAWDSPPSQVKWLHSVAILRINSHLEFCSQTCPPYRGHKVSKNITRTDIIRLKCS